MKILRCSAAVVAASIFAVLATPRISEADPITFSFSGVLGDCATPPLPGVCINDFSGHVVAGQFTTDSALSTLLAASFTVLGPTNFTWRILSPDPVPNSVTFSVSPMSLFIEESLILPFPEFENFNSPLTASAGSTLNTGFIERQGAVGIHNPFVSGAANVVPEPSSLLLLGTGFMGFVARRRFFPFNR